MNRLPAGTGWTWLTQGFALFRKQPGLLTMLLFSTTMVTLMLSVIPIVGGIVSTILLPAFSMVIFDSCRQLEAGERVTPAVLLTGFQEGKAGPLAKLGMVYFILSIVLSLAVLPWIDLGAFQAAAKAAQAKQDATLPAGAVTGLLVLIALLAAMVLSLSFAPALTHWKKMPTFKAIFYSVFAVIGSLGPMLVLLASWCGIQMFLFGVIVLLLGSTQFVMAVLMLMCLTAATVLQCALYAAYRHLIPDTE